MELKLRKARKLETLVNSYCAVDSKFCSVDILASTPDEEATDILLSSKKALQEQNENVLKLIEVKYSIRRKIEQANESIGISVLMNKRETIKNKISYYESLTNLDTCENKELLDLLASKRAALDKGGMFSGKVNVTASTLSKLEKEALEVQMEQLQRQLEDVEEELLQKNVGGKITLSAEEVEVLKLNGLV